MKYILGIIAVLVVLVIAGCAPKVMPASSAPTATDKAVTDVGGAVSDLDALAQELDTADLNSLDQELADIESLELQ